MPSITPDSLATTGHKVSAERLNAMTTAELLTYFAEVRFYQSIYEAEADAIKELALTRPDLPKKFTHPDPNIGGVSQKGIGAKAVISSIGVKRHIGDDLFMTVAKVGKGDLEKVVTPEQMAAMKADGTFQGGASGVTIQYDKP